MSRSPPSLITLTLLTALSALTLNMVLPSLGPMLGGVLDVTLGWRAVFALYALLGGALLLLAWTDMGETRPMGLPASRLADWVALLRSSSYWAYDLCTALSVGAFYVFVTGVPYVGKAAWGLSPAEVGLGVGSITGGFLVGAAISARQARRMGVGVLLALPPGSKHLRCLPLITPCRPFLPRLRIC